ncbi:unnamed protein product [Orchesella dallaii]|uniref:MIF4G domain-containing protein n=1 Tax=Orchesella dallaii TaxID=48710 RepID=A0ABP1PR73_9HEXA
MENQRDHYRNTLPQQSTESHSSIMMNINTNSNAESDFNRMRTLSETSEDGRKSIFPIKNERDNILRKVRSVLNKVSSLNYHALQKRWLSVLPHGDGPENNMPIITEVLQLVVNKALDDTIYMNIYARMMGDLAAGKADGACHEVRLLINSQLHHELQKLATDKELAQFDRSIERADAARRRKVSLHRFVAELYCEKGCTSKFLIERVKDLLIMNNPANVDENIECLCVVLTFAGAKLEENKKKWLDDIFQKLSRKQTENPQALSKRIQFMILDLMEMRLNGWSPHNKWWSPSVKISNEDHVEHRANSTSNPRNKAEGSSCSERGFNNGTTSGSVNSGSNEPPRKVTKKGKQRSSSSRSSSRASRERAVKDRNGSNVMSLQEMRTLRRNLVGLLNKVSPENLHRIATQLEQYLPKCNEDPSMDVAVDIIVDKVLSDGMYVRIHANLIARVVQNDTIPSFGERIVMKVLEFAGENPNCVDAFRFLGELYQCDLIGVDRILATLERIIALPSENLIPAVESIAIFLFTVGAKLDAEVSDRNWMSGVLEHLNMTAGMIPLPSNQNRSLCLVMNVIQLRNSNWEHQQTPQWFPCTASMFSNRFETEGFIRLFGEDKQEFLRFFKLRCPTWKSIDRFFKDALEYSVCCGDWEKDPGFLRMTGACIHFLVKEGFISRGRLQNFVGSFVERVMWMGRKNYKAWDNFGRILEEVY